MKKLSCHLLLCENSLTPKLVSVVLQHKLHGHIIFCGLKHVHLHFGLKEKKKERTSENLLCINAQEVFMFNVMAEKTESGKAISSRCERKIDSRCRPGRGSVSSLPVQMTYYHSLCPPCLFSHANCAR